MTEEERQLLLTALCGYLPYKVKCFAEDREYGDLGTLYSVDPFENVDPNIYIQYENGNVISFFTSEIKPYLRPMSSMTEEEKKSNDELLEKIYKMPPVGHIHAAMITDWFLERHFDVHDLIPKGLALEAPEGMYN